MARYLIFKPAIVNGRYVDAAMGNPTEIDVAADMEPSRTWEPLDKEAVSALDKLGVKKKIYDRQSLVRQSLSNVWPSKSDDPGSAFGPDPVVNPE